MFVARKYIFETKFTKYKRGIKNFFFILIALFFVYTFSCWYLLYFAKSAMEASKSALNLRSPDLVAIFTGDGGRISQGLRWIKKNPEVKIFITGVYNRNTINSLIRHNKIKDLSDTELDHIDIDYQARNTVENVLSTLLYIRKKQQSYKRILVISSDYHLSRINLIFNKIRSPSDDFQVLLLGSESKFDNLRSIRILYREVYKWIQTYFFLLLWDNEYVGLPS